MGIREVLADHPQKLQEREEIQAEEDRAADDAQFHIGVHERIVGHEPVDIREPVMSDAEEELRAANFTEALLPQRNAIATGFFQIDRRLSASHEGDHANRQRPQHRRGSRAGP